MPTRGTKYKQAREELRQWAVKWTDECDVQTSKSGLWPCGTCFNHLLRKIGLKPHKPEYNECNKPRDRSNEVWRAILQIRDSSLRKR